MKYTFSTGEAAFRLTQVYDGTCFSYAGAIALAEYLHEYEDGIGEEIEFDAIGICCDFSEHLSLADWAEDYFSNWAEEFGIDYTDSNGEEHSQSLSDEDGDIHDEILDAIREYINDHGTLIEFDGGIIVSSF